MKNKPNTRISVASYRIEWIDNHGKSAELRAVYCNLDTRAQMDLFAITHTYTHSIAKKPLQLAFAI